MRGFHGELLGLREIRVPDTLERDRLVWFSAGTDALELHFFQGTPDPAHARHLAIAVEDVDGTRSRLAAAGYAPYGAAPIRNRPRFFCRDSFGACSSSPRFPARRRNPAPVPERYEHSRPALGLGVHEDAG